MSDDTAYSISSMTEAVALADSDMLEIERPDGNPSAEPPVLNSWLRVTGLKIANYVLGKVAGGNGTRVEIVSGQLTVVGRGAEVVFITTAAHTLSLVNMDRFNACNNASAQSITVPAQTTVAWPDHVQLEGCQYGAGAVTFVAGAGVTIRRNAKITATTDGVNSPWALKRLGVNEWLLVGQMVAT